MANSEWKKTAALFCAILALLIGFFGLIFGIFGIYDACYSRGSGEWSGLGILFLAIVNIPCGLVVAGCCYFIKNKPVRLISGALALFALISPFISMYGLQMKKNRESEEINRQMQQYQEEQLKKDRTQPEKHNEK